MLFKAARSWMGETSGPDASPTLNGEASMGSQPDVKWPMRIGELPLMLREMWFQRPRSVEAALAERLTLPHAG